MDPIAGTAAVFVFLVVAALFRLIVQGAAGFLFEGIVQVARAAFSVILWMIGAVFRLVWWILVGWWWRKWVSPALW
jgi:hypothetical protein